MWRIAGASAAGASHLRAGTPCQDAFSYHLLPGEVVLLIAADGAGSAQRGQLGAELAVQAASGGCIVDTVEGCDGEVSTLVALVQHAFYSARQALDAACDGPQSLRELATTLQVLLIGPRGWAYGGVGDGGGVGRDDTGTWTVSPPHQNVYVNETIFLTSEYELRTASGAEVLTGAALFTDGLERLAMRTSDWTPHPGFFGPVFRLLELTQDTSAANKLLALLGSERVQQRTDDDCTLVICVKGDDRA